MSEFSITQSVILNEGGEIPKKFGYKHGNEAPHIDFENIPQEPFSNTNAYPTP